MVFSIIINESTMHELAVTRSILEIATRYASQANASRVTDIYLVIGQLSTIVDDSVSSIGIPERKYHLSRCFAALPTDSSPDEVP